MSTLPELPHLHLVRIVLPDGHDYLGSDGTAEGAWQLTLLRTLMETLYRREPAAAAHAAILLADAIRSGTAIRARAEPSAPKRRRTPTP